jgi:hypothetical protein
MRTKGYAGLLVFALGALLISYTFAAAGYLRPGALLPGQLFADGFESGDFSAWTGISGTPTVQSTTIHHGTFAALSADADDYCYKTGMTSASPRYSRGYFRFSALPSSGNRLSLMSTMGSDVVGRVDIYNDVGTIKWRLWTDDPAGFTAFDTPNPIVGTWYCVELVIVSGVDIELYIDGVHLGSRTTVQSGTIATLYIGGWDKTDSINVYWDCVVVADRYIGSEGSEVFYYPLSARWTTISGNPTDRHDFEPVHNIRIVEVNKVVDGASRKYLAYDSDANGYQIRLYYADDLDGQWTPYSGNPILSGSEWAQCRWPSVAYVSGVFHMFKTNFPAGCIERWTSSDGINFAFQEKIISGGQVTRNPFIWLNPNDNKYYLYHRDYVGGFQYIKVRSATNIADLDSATDTIIFSQASGNLGSPSIMFRDGQYWLLIETTSSAGIWNVNAYYSSSSTSGFVECGNSPILINDEACGMHFLSPDGTKAYLFSNRDSTNWYQDTREVDPTTTVISQTTATTATIATTSTQAGPTYTLTLYVSGQGSTSLTPGVYAYPTGTVVSLYIVSGSLSYWTLDGTSMGTQPINFIMTTNHQINIIFTQQNAPSALNINYIVIGAILMIGGGGLAYDDHIKEQVELHSTKKRK